jgi:hypothetical protein
LSTPEYLPFLEGRARELGRYIGVAFAEGFTSDRPVGLPDLMVLG